MSDRINPALLVTASVDPASLVDPVCCGEEMRETGCDAPDCAGMACGTCGGGCDLDVVGGACDQAMVAAFTGGAGREAREETDRRRHGLVTAPEQLDLLGGGDGRG